MAGGHRGRRGEERSGPSPRSTCEGGQCGLCDHNFPINCGNKHEQPPCENPSEGGSCSECMTGPDWVNLTMIHCLRAAPGFTEGSEEGRSSNLG